jgi:4'-phosphopantetheinyl transferase
MSSHVTIDIWPIELRGVVSDADRALLSGPETDRAARRRNPADAADFATVRAALRRHLGMALGLAPQAIPLVDQPGLGPVLSPGPDLRPSGGTGGRIDPADGLRFNVSHTSGLALVAIARGARVGVDVERITPITEDLAALILSDRERQEVQAMPPAERTRAVLRAWTRKEAVLKGLGVGVERAPSTLDVPLAAVVTNQPPDGIDPDWRIFGLDAGSDWVAAVAVEAGDRDVDLRVHPPDMPLQSTPMADS